MEEDEDLENYYSSVYSMLVTEHLSLEDDQLKNPERAGFDEAVLGENESRLRERKPNALAEPWKRQTAFMEEVDDEFWEEFKALKKSEKHLLY